jgi:hypothetical protein
MGGIELNVLQQAANVGAVVDLRVGDPSRDDPEFGWAWRDARAISAEALEQLVAPSGSRPVRRAVRIAGARITGALDLSGAHLICPLELIACYFDDPVSFEGATCPSLSLQASYLRGGLLADGIDVRGDIELSDGFVSKRGVRLRDARIARRVNLSGATVGTSELIALDLGGTDVGGDVWLDGFTARGMVWAAGARIRGSVLCRSASLTNDSGVALCADHADIGLHFVVGHGFSSRGDVTALGVTVGGNVDCNGGKFVSANGRALTLSQCRVGGLDCGSDCRVDGGLWLTEARVLGQWNCSGGRFVAGSADFAIAADGITVSGGTYLTDGFHASGEVSIIGGIFSSPFYVANATFRHRGEAAFTLDGAECRSQLRFASSVSAEGEVRLVNVRVGLDATPSGDFANRGETALFADGLSTGRSLDLVNITAIGTVRVLGARIGGQLRMDRCVFSAADGIAFGGDGMRVEADAYLSSVEAQGQVTIAGAYVGGQMVFDDCVVRNPDGIALRLIRTVVNQELGLTFRSPLVGIFILRDSSVGALRDGSNAWEGSYELSGFHYGDLAGDSEQALKRHFWERDPDCGARLRWLRRASDGRAAQPYDELVHHYGRIGHEWARRRTLIRKQRVRRGDLGPVGHAWGYIQEFLVGYGYRAWQALIPSALLLGFAWLFFAGHRGDFSQTVPTDVAPHFSALLYALDVLLPVVSLGQRSAYTSHGFAGTVSAALTISGWILTTAIVAALAGFVSRGD